MLGIKRKTSAVPSLEGIPFTEVAGNPPKKPLTVFALSTCGFCRRALAFLDDNGFAYSYVHMDKLPKDQQDIIRNFVKAKYRVSISFPFLCLGDDDFLTGFIKPSWVKELADE